MTKKGKVLTIEKDKERLKGVADRVYIYRNREIAYFAHKDNFIDVSSRLKNFNSK